MRVIYLAEREWEKLKEVISYATDEGPVDEGWKSSTLVNVESKVRDAMEIPS